MIKIVSAPTIASGVVGLLTWAGLMLGHVEPYWLAVSAAMFNFAAGILITRIWP